MVVPVFPASVIVVVNPGQTVDDVAVAVPPTDVGLIVILPEKPEVTAGVQVPLTIQ
jgi:hypothetical protein